MFRNEFYGATTSTVVRGLGAVGLYVMERATGGEICDIGGTWKEGIRPLPASLPPVSGLCEPFRANLTCKQGI
jgi:hypothetical protein